MNIGIICKGAIARYVLDGLESRGHDLRAILVRPEKVADAAALDVGAAGALQDDLKLVIDCAGHGALAEYGPQILARGIEWI